MNSSDREPVKLPMFFVNISGQAGKANRDVHVKLVLIISFLNRMTLGKGAR